MGGIMIGSRKARYTAFLPGKSRRASTYEAGTPTSTDSTTTAAATSRVTTMTRSSPKSAQAWLYHWVVRPCGSQVPNHLVPNELTSTEPTTPTSRTRNATTAPQTSQAPGLATTRLRAGSVGTAGAVAGAGA